MLEDHHYLYVEDDPASREAMRITMEFVLRIKTLTIFEDSSDFLDRLRQLPHQPDVIFLDLNMAPYSGFDLLAMIRTDPLLQSNLVVAVTASLDEDINHLRNAGFDAAIPKPLDLEKFPGMLERIVRGETVWDSL
ncbi:MAG: response regulator [Chloroflexi bacterium]|nr:response regulator [Chloroflexota bacterium]